MIDVEMLREKVKDLAVQGGMTADFSTSSNAIEEVEQLSGKVLKDNHYENPPYSIKTGWCWLKLEDLGINEKNAFADGPFGSNLKREHYTLEHQVRIIQLSNVGTLGWKDENEKYTTYEHLETIKRSEVKAGNIVIAKMMPAGRAIIVPEVSDAYVLSSDCVKFVPLNGLNTKYLCYAINSTVFRNQVMQDVHGIGRERTSLSKLKSYYLPIPPIEEQNLIVEKIDLAYELIAEIEEKQAKFFLDKEVLKNKIVEAGLRGVLVNQIDEDGSAESLIAAIQSEKNELIKNGKIKRGKKLKDIEDDEISYQIPKNWKWVRVGEVINEVIVPQRDKPAFDKEGTIPWCRIEDKEGIYLNGTQSGQYVSQKTIDEMNLRVCPVGTILAACSGASIGTVLITTVECCTNQSFNGLVCNEKMYNWYLFYYLKSKIAEMKQMGTGSAMAYISQDKFRNMVIPLPPYNEQVRIVKRINEVLSVV